MGWGRRSGDERLAHGSHQGLEALPRHGGVALVHGALEVARRGGPADLARAGHEVDQPGLGDPGAAVQGDPHLPVAPTLESATSTMSTTSFGPGSWSR